MSSSSSQGQWRMFPIGKLFGDMFHFFNSTGRPCMIKLRSVAILVVSCDCITIYRRYVYPGCASRRGKPSATNCTVRCPIYQVQTKSFMNWYIYGAPFIANASSYFMRYDYVWVGMCAFDTHGNAIILQPFGRNHLYYGRLAVDIDETARERRSEFFPRVLSQKKNGLFQKCLDYGK